MRISTNTSDGIHVTFHWGNHDALPQAVHDSRYSGQLMGGLASLTLEDKVRQKLDPSRVVSEYENVFRMIYRDYLHIGMWILSFSYTLVHRPFL